MKDFGTFAVNNVKHCVMNGHKVGEQVEAVKEMKKGALLTEQSRCGDNKVAEKWMNGHSALGKIKETYWGNTEDSLFVKEHRRGVFSAKKNGDHVMHIYSEHNQEADFMAHLRQKELVERFESTAA